MKRQLQKAIFAAVLLCTSAGANAQITLTQSDLPKDNQRFIIHRADSLIAANISPGSSGANQNWNFSQVDSTKKATKDTIRFFNPAGTPFAGVFPDATLTSFRTHKSGEVPLLSFYKTDSMGLKVIGFIHADTVRLRAFPYETPLLSYNQTFFHYGSTRHDVVNDSNYGSSWSFMSSKADAWGKITTPSGTVDAIRIYTTEKFYDTAYVNGAPARTSIDSSSYSYKWYAKGIGIPVFEITNVHFDNKYAGTILEYADSLPSNTTSSLHAAVLDFASIYPVPVKESVNINVSGSAVMTLYSIEGKMIWNKKLDAGTNSLNMDNLPAGIYTYSLRNSAAVQKGKLLKQ